MFKTKFTVRTLIVLNFILGLGAMAWLGFESTATLTLTGLKEDTITTPVIHMFLNVPIGALIILFIFKLLHKFEKHKENLERSNQYVRVEAIGIFSLLLLVQALLVASTVFGIGVDIAWLITVMGILMMVGGNYLPKTRSNTMLGLPTPYAMKSETVWIKTHRLAGRMLIIGGFVIAVSSFIVTDDVTLAKVLFVAALLPMFVAMCMSYVFYRQEKNSK